MIFKRIVFLLIIMFSIIYCVTVFAGNFQIAAMDPQVTTVDRLVVVQKEGNIKNIIVFLETLQTQGSLTGAGKTPVASESRLEAFKNLLNTADILIEMDDISGACQQLERALKKSDGQLDNPDYVEGPNASEVNQLIKSFINKLGCI